VVSLCSLVSGWISWIEVADELRRPFTGKLEKARDRIEWMRRNKGSVKWRHVTELLGWLEFECVRHRGSHTYWVHPSLENEENPSVIVKPHKNDTITDFDVKTCISMAQDVMHRKESI